jgi:anti-sigma-K factor RskA
MERTEIHELSAAYALDALDADERLRYEEHLGHCEECQEAVAAFHDTAASLAHGVESRQPPASLRDRILDEAASEGQKVAPLRPRWSIRVTSAVAAVAAIAALAFGLWALALHDQLGERPQAIPLTGATGQLVVSPDRAATLVVDDLAPAPPGKTYEAWVISDDETKPAGTFAGGATRTAFALTQSVPDGATVAVTVEPAGGSDAPTSEVRFSASDA